MIERQMMTDEDMQWDHRITRELGGMTVDEMRARMTTAEMEEHKAYIAAKKAHGGN